MKLNLCSILLTSIISCILFAGCANHPQNKNLQKADELMETNSIDALAILDSCDVSTLSKSDIPYHALFTAQAKAKNYITLSSDSLLLTAHNALGDQKDNYGIRANFYFGMHHFDHKSYRKAIPYALSAYYLSKELDDNYWMGKSTELIADIYDAVYNFESAIKYHKLSTIYYRKAKKTLFERYAIADWAFTAMNLKKYDECIQVLDSLRSVCVTENPIDSDFVKYLQNPLVTCYIRNGQVDKIKNLKILSLENNKNLSYDELILRSRLDADAKDSSINTLISEKIFKSPNQQHKGRLLYELYKRAKKNGDYTYAVSLTDSLLLMQSNIAEAMLKESVTAEERDFIEQQSIIKERQAHSQILYLIIICALILIISISAIVIFHYRVKTHKEEIDNLAHSINILRLESEHATIENKLVIEQLFTRQWHTLNILCRDYENIDSVPTLRNTYLENIKNEVQKLRLSSNLDQVEAAVNRYCGNIISLFRTELPSATSDEIHLMALSCTGMSYKTISIFLNISINTLYQRRNRLKKKIESSDAPHKEQFIDRFSIPKSST